MPSQSTKIDLSRCVVAYCVTSGGRRDVHGATANTYHYDSKADDSKADDSKADDFKPDDSKTNDSKVDGSEADGDRALSNTDDEAGVPGAR
jgi:hypothetical protein